MIQDAVQLEVVLNLRLRDLVVATEVGMEVDDRRHDRLAGQVDACRAGRDLQLAGSTDAEDPASLNRERRVLDGCAAVVHDEACAFEHRDASGSSPLAKSSEGVTDRATGTSSGVRCTESTSPVTRLEQPLSPWRTPRGAPILESS